MHPGGYGVAYGEGWAYAAGEQDDVLEISDADLEVADFVLEESGTSLLVEEDEPAAAALEPELKLKKHPELEPEPEAAIAPKPGLKLSSEPELEPETKPKPEPDKQPEPEPEPALASAPEPDKHPKPESEPAPEPEPALALPARPLSAPQPLSLGGLVPLGELSFVHDCPPPPLGRGFEAPLPVRYTHCVHTASVSGKVGALLQCWLSTPEIQ